jgi:hypothetical protein
VFIWRAHKERSAHYVYERERVRPVEYIKEAPPVCVIATWCKMLFVLFDTLSYCAWAALLMSAICLFEGEIYTFCACDAACLFRFAPREKFGV